MRKIIDSHSHYMPPEVAKNTAFFKIHWSDLNRQLEVMDQNNIEKSLLLYPTSDAHLQMGGWENVCRIYNEGIAEVVSKHKNRFIGAGIIPVDNPKAILKELKRFKELNLTLISLASSYNGRYLDEDIFQPVFEFAQSEKMPVHVHSQILNPIGEERVKDPLLSPVLEYVFDVSMCLGKMMMNGVFTKFSNVNFIFAHYGGVLPIVKERFDNTYQMLRKRNFVKDIGKNPSDYFKNLFFCMSGSKSPGSLLCMLEVADSKHILWGSDYPANQNIRETISFLDEVGIKREERDAIFSKNILSLISLKG